MDKKTVNERRIGIDGKIMPSHLSGEIQARINELEQVISYASNQINKLPAGKIHVAPGHNSHNFRYYVMNASGDRKEEYLDKTKAELKMQLSQKRYFEEIVRQGRLELKALQKASDKMNGDSLITSYSRMGLGIREKITPIIVDDASFIERWNNIKYESLGFNENDNTEYYSERGERMRSKSEMLIANMLYKYHIPYKYECPIKRINGEYLYPDFTILDIKQRRTIYWEHLGRMGDLSYVSKNLWKLDEYKRVGIILGIDLYLTYESDLSSLGTKEIKRIVEMLMPDKIN